MNHPDFTELRCLIDEAITFNDLDTAKNFANQGLEMAQSRKCLGEEMYFRAQFEIIKENFTQALLLLDQAILHNPKDGAAYNDRALSMIELGQIEGVMEYFDKGIYEEPDYATIYHNKGWFLNNLGQHEKALLCFQKTLELDSQRAVTYENIANVYENLGKWEDALQSYQKALTLLAGAYPEIQQQLSVKINLLRERL